MCLLAFAVSCVFVCLFCFPRIERMARNIFSDLINSAASPPVPLVVLCVLKGGYQVFSDLLQFMNKCNRSKHSKWTAWCICFPSSTAHVCMRVFVRVCMRRCMRSCVHLWEGRGGCSCVFTCVFLLKCLWCVSVGVCEWLTEK